MILLLKIPPHLKCVATLPCEMSVRGLRARTRYLAKFVKNELLTASCRAPQTLPEKNSLRQNSHPLPLF